MDNIKQIAEHSIDLDLLTGGACIDIGCRGFQFSQAMADLGLFVIAFDLEMMKPPDSILFNAIAVTRKSGVVKYKETKDPQAKHLSDEGTGITSIGLNELYGILLKERPVVDVLKLDCEGSEYDILSDPDFQPIPRQITVEFHEHAHKALHDQYFQACMDNLLKHYVAVKHDRYAAHGAGMNWWDSLFIRKDLV